MLTEEGHSLEIEFPGVPSREGGPDFREARLRIDGRPAVGDVELHLTTAGWEGHRHDGDSAYQSVILHVALRRDRYHRGTHAFAGDRIAELVLEQALERSEVELLAELNEPRSLTAPVPKEVLMSWGDARFERRVEQLRTLAKRHSIDELFVREVFIALGYKHNKAGFAELSRLVPLVGLQGLDATAIEERLSSAAERILWRTRGVRPANHPRRRIAGAARWLAAVGVRSPHLPHFEHPVEELFDPDGSGLIGSERASALVANVVLPLMAAEGTAAESRRARDLFRSLPGLLENRRARDAAALLGVRDVASLREAWGLLEFNHRTRGRLPEVGNGLAPPKAVC